MQYEGGYTRSSSAPSRAYSIGLATSSPTLHYQKPLAWICGGRLYTCHSRLLVDNQLGPAAIVSVLRRPRRGGLGKLSQSGRRSPIPTRNLSVALTYRVVTGCTEYPSACIKSLWWYVCVLRRFCSALCAATQYEGLLDSWSLAHGCSCSRSSERCFLFQREDRTVELRLGKRTHRLWLPPRSPAYQR